MIVYRFWTRRARYTERLWEGWFLLGIVPLYVRLAREVTR